MRIAQHWARCTRGTGADAVTAVGWSFVSPEEARRDAEARAQRMRDRLSSGKKPDTYGYFDRPMREETVDALRLGEREAAVVTRNRYGALVLNAASVLFADVDYPAPDAKGLKGFLSAFSGARRARQEQEARDRTLQNVRDWFRARPAHAARLYRTRAGLRVLFTDALYEPKSEKTVAILQSIGSDPLYRLLTDRQECFRARLTPKPWRCGLRQPPRAYPWDDAAAEREQRDWERDYAAGIRGHRTCELADTFGPDPVIEEIRAVVALHDALACAGPADAPLA